MPPAVPPIPPPPCCGVLSRWVSLSYVHTRPTLIGTKKGGLCKTTKEGEASTGEGSEISEGPDEVCPEPQEGFSPVGKDRRHHQGKEEWQALGYGPTAAGQQINLT
jgi:hypothetical protein